MIYPVHVQFVRGLEEHKKTVGGPRCLEGLDEAVVGYVRRLKVAQLSHSRTVAVEHPNHIAQNRLLDDCDSGSSIKPSLLTKVVTEQITEIGTGGFRSFSLEKRSSTLICAGIVL